MGQAARDGDTNTQDLLRFSSFTVSLSRCPPFALIRYHLSHRANARNWTPGQPSIISIYGWTKVCHPVRVIWTRFIRQPLSTRRPSNTIFSSIYINEALRRKADLTALEMQPLMMDGSGLV